MSGIAWEPEPAPPTSIEKDGSGRVLHVRRIGVGGCASEPALRSVFAAYGTFESAVVRHRMDGKVNTSWALVRMTDVDAAERALRSVVMAPDGVTQLKVTPFSLKIAKSSSGGLKQLEERSEDEQCTLHVRRIGMGGCKSEMLLRQVFSQFGGFVSATVRERTDPSGADTSWALVTMATATAARAALQAVVMAPDGTTQLKITEYSQKQAAISTGGMTAVQADHMQRLQTRRAEARASATQARLQGMRAKHQLRQAELAENQADAEEIRSVYEELANVSQPQQGDPVAWPTSGGAGGLRQRRPSMALPAAQRPLRTAIRREDLEATSSVPYQRLVVSWIVGVGVIGGVLIWWIEYDNPAFKPPQLDGLSRAHLLWSCIFCSMNGVTATGLATLDITSFTWLSQLVLLFTMQFGSATMLTLVPAYIRMRSLSKIVGELKASNPALAGRDFFDLTTYSRIPQWLIEFKAMELLVILVLLYQVAVHLVCGGLMYVLLATDAEASGYLSTATGQPPSVLWFCVFHAVSAYCNCGFALLPSSMILFAHKPGILFCLVGLIIAGNTLLPVLLRWTITWASSLIDDQSSKKVFIRHLILNGRMMYPNLFNSQQTWLLLLGTPRPVCTHTVLACLDGSCR